jgi:hypothetical protein
MIDFRANRVDADADLDGRQVGSIPRREALPYALGEGVGGRDVRA